MAGDNHKFTMGLVHPGKLLLIIPAGFHHKPNALLREYPTRGSDRPFSACRASRSSLDQWPQPHKPVLPLPRSPVPCDTTL